MTQFINTKSQLRDLMALFGDKNLIYNGPTLKFANEKSSRNSASRVFSTGTKDFFSSAEIEKVNELLQSLVDRANEMRAERRNQHKPLIRPDFDYVLNVPFENWKIVFWAQLYTSCYISSVGASECTVYHLSPTIDLHIDNPERGCIGTFQCYYNYQSDIEEQDLLAVVASSRTDVAAHLDRLFEIVSSKLTGFYENQSLTYGALDDIVLRFSSLSKCVMADRDF